MERGPISRNSGVSTFQQVASQAILPTAKHNDQRYTFQPQQRTPQMSYTLESKRLSAGYDQ